MDNDYQEDTRIDHITDTDSSRILTSGSSPNGGSLN